MVSAASFRAEIAKERAKAGLPPVEGEAAGVSADAKGRKRKDGVPNAAPPAKPTDEELYQQALSIADPNEPKCASCHGILGPWPCRSCRQLQ